MSAADGSQNLLSSLSREAPPAPIVHRDLAGLSLDDILGTDTHRPKPPPPLYPTSAHITRTLIEIIRDEPDQSSYKTLVDDRDRKAWKSFKDRLKLRRAGCAWTPSISTPSCDGPIRGFRKNDSSSSAPLHLSHPHYISDKPRLIQHSANMDEDSGGQHMQFRDFPDQQHSRPVMARRTSVRTNSESPDPTPMRPQFSRHNSTRAASARFLNRCETSVAPKDEMSMEMSEAEDRLARLSMAEGRQMSAREAAVAQEAAEAAAAATAAEEEDDDEVDEEEDREGMGGEKAVKGEEGQPRMSLMDLLGDYEEEEDEEEDYDKEEEEEEEEEEDGGSEVAEADGYKCCCCVCMVKHKVQPMVPCGHSYCKLCTKEMYVSRGNCPICNNFIQEIITVF
ncbi:hypothetical protein SAY87_007505 [Trapa incisa]|uniref:RING-type domain-containing protein n=1 Tax=Trapa incisa TaxID=236973 RepID=A0AAN7KJE4_9MYRT|nr:hypothetical protein SAY87_007505 [Trapa incisa]